MASKGRSRRFETFGSNVFNMVIITVFWFLISGAYYGVKVPLSFNHPVTAKAEGNPSWHRKVEGLNGNDPLYDV